MDLYLFNPDADLALGNGEENYMAPASIRRMADDLAMLPLWYAPPGSAVWVPSASGFLEQMCRLFPLPVCLLSEAEFPEHSDLHPHPWGWSPALRRRMLNAGLSECVLPSGRELEILRRQSGRHSALELLAAFEGWDDCCGTGTLLHTLSDCEHYLRKQGTCLFKAPWSGSGKGLLWCRTGFTPQVAGWCRHQLAGQGFLVGMPVYKKLLDFAMEFRADGKGAISFTGYSLFETNAKGAYLGNRLESDGAVEQRITRYVPLSTLRKIRACLEERLPQVYAGYAGPLGVDMMVCRLDEVPCYAIFPCVEVNLRMSMGMVARIFFDRFMLPGGKGRFCVEAFPEPMALQEAHAADMRRFPLVVREGRLLSGYLSLTPVMPETRYRICVRVEEEEECGPALEK